MTRSYRTIALAAAVAMLPATAVLAQTAGSSTADGSPSRRANRRADDANPRRCDGE